MANSAEGRLGDFFKHLMKKEKIKIKGPSDGEELLKKETDKVPKKSPKVVRKSKKTKEVKEVKEVKKPKEVKEVKKSPTRKNKTVRISKKIEKKSPPKKKKTVKSVLKK
jgi:hypothetical protein